MHVEEIEYEADGRRMVGTFAVDDYRRGARPGVLVCHEGPGLDNHVKGRAIRLASFGYAAFALDYQGDGVAPPFDQGMARLVELMVDPARVRALGRAGLDVLPRARHHGKRCARRRQAGSNALPDLTFVAHPGDDSYPA